VKKNRHSRRAAQAVTPRKKDVYLGTDLLTHSDPLNFTTVKIQTLYNDTIIGNATGFFYFGFLGEKPNYWFVTNWHVLSGRNVQNPFKSLDSTGRVPNRIRLKLEGVMHLAQGQRLV
jgi:hypothetical protein